MMPPTGLTKAHVLGAAMFLLMSIGVVMLLWVGSLFDSLVSLLHSWLGEETGGQSFDSLLVATNVPL